MRIINDMRILPTAVLMLLFIVTAADARPGEKYNYETNFQQPKPRKIRNGAHYAEDVNSGKIRKDNFIGSPNRKVSASFGNCNVAIRYSSPGVRGRTIWGKLVPYNKIWVTGANHATTITFDCDLQVNNRKVPAGTYAIFTIPGDKKWVVILNKNTDQHLADDYSEKDDVLRFAVTPAASPVMVQRLTYNIEPKDGNMALVSMVWEKRKISFVLKKYQQN